jgi:hypothetical protein
MPDANNLSPSERYRELRDDIHGLFEKVGAVETSQALIVQKVDALERSVGDRCVAREARLDTVEQILRGNGRVGLIPRVDELSRVVTEHLTAQKDAEEIRANARREEARVIKKWLLGLVGIVILEVGGGFLFFAWLGFRATLGGTP